MDFGRLIRSAGLALIFCCAMGSPGGAPLAATFLEFVDPNPAPGNQFGISVTPLSTGNVVITSPFDDAGGPNFGAVYLFNGATGALISTLRGSTTNDLSAVFVIALSNGNYVVLCRLWNNGGAVDAGAATFGSGTIGVSGVVSAANSLVGTTANDFASTSVTALSNGNYVVSSPTWDNGGLVNAGAVTWGNGTSGVTGAVSAVNSLVGSSANDNVGSSGVTGLLSGNYLVASRVWDNGTDVIVNAGAVTWCNGTTGRTGVISAANSLVGSTASDEVGGNGVTELLNGNYVVRNASWDNGAIVNAGAATWGNGATGVSGAISAANSLVGTTANDNVSSNFVYALANGNYVVVSQNWDNGAISNVGAATWGSGTTGVTGAVSAANSLIGSTANDQVGLGVVTALSNGNYVVSSFFWDNGAVVNAGAATWRSGTSGAGAVVSAANSLVGTTANDQVSAGGVTALSNGNYVVRSGAWHSADVGAATFGNGTTGVTGAVSAANSLVGSTTSDQVGAHVIALSNGNYVVGSPFWDNGAIVNAGAVTWGNGSTGVTGVVTTANSLVGSTTSESVGGFERVTALSNGNYVVITAGWDNGAVTDVGAVTWCDGTTGRTGVISAANSLVGSKANDLVGLVADGASFDNGVTALTNGNYVVASAEWDNGGLVDAGAVTWGNGSAGVTGVVSAANSLIGSTVSDRVGGTSVTPLANGNYVVCSEWWEDGGGGVVNAGAATWGDGSAGVTGVVSAANSLVGESGNAGLLSVVVDIVNDTYIARFMTDVGGRVRVGPRDFSPMIVSAFDIPYDQGGWVRLIFNRSSQDVAPASAIATYGIWRHVPGTIPAGAGEANLSAAPGSRLDPRANEALRAALPSGLDVREAGGRLYVVGPTIASEFPPGTWELVASVGATQQAQYVVATPTISNAAPNDFVVTAHAITPSLWFVSELMAGQSVDNLAPAQPTQLAGSYSGGQTNIQWAANTENDVGSYRVYRGTAADFTPDGGNQIATVISPGYADVGPAGSYYKVSAVDVNGNQSSFALLTPWQTTGVEGESSVAFALEGVWPNPSNGNGLHVAFALPSRAAGRLELLDVSGRRLLAHEVGSLVAGRHRVNLAAGRKIASGIYWVRLTQGTNQRKTRVAVIE